MKLIILLITMLLNNPMIREMACIKQTKCDGYVCATKWSCPLGIKIVEPKEVE